MIKIPNQSAFDELIKSNTDIIIFVHSIWSGYSVMAKNTVLEFEKSLDLNIHYEENKESSFMYDMLHNYELTNASNPKFSFRTRLNGYGEIIWLRNKKVIGFEIVSSKLSVNDLIEKHLAIMKI